MQQGLTPHQANMSSVVELGQARKITIHLPGIDKKFSCQRRQMGTAAASQIAVMGYINFAQIGLDGFRPQQIGPLPQVSPLKPG